MADGLFSTLYKKAVPVNARLALEQFTGTTAPITEKDFTPEELAALRKAVEGTQRFNEDREAVYRANLKKSKKEYEKNPEYRFSMDPDKPQGKDPIPYSQWKAEQEKAVASFEKNRDKTSFGYGSYDVKSGDMAAPIGQNWLDAAYQSYTDPAFRMAATIGSANYFNKPGQTPYVEDSYKFKSHPEAYGDTSKMSTMDLISKFGNTPGTLLELLASRYAPQQRPVNIALPPQEPTNPSYQDPFGFTIK
jgi:hypothetical protein